MSSNAKRPVSLPSPDPRIAKVALFERFDTLVDRLPWRPLGHYPTPVHRLGAHEALWVKREDLSSPAYGGNKVRTVEGHLGRALHLGHNKIWSTGAFGSNHALCTAIHGLRCGIEVGAVLFAQPPTLTAQANLRALVSIGTQVRALWSPLSLPVHIAQLHLQPKVSVMTPGGAVPRGALGHVSAALELCQQVRDGVCPAPKSIVLPVGSTCTSAGLLLGLQLAARMGWWPGVVPKLRCVAIGPWPFTSKAAVVWLSRRTRNALQGLVGRPLGVSDADLNQGLEVEHAFVGKGYGHPTAMGCAAMEAFERSQGPALDPVYSAKAAASLFAASGPTLFWSTKSSAPLPQASGNEAYPWLMRRWLRKAPLAAPALPAQGSYSMLMSQTDEQG